MRAAPNRSAVLGLTLAACGSLPILSCGGPDWRRTDHADSSSSKYAEALRELRSSLDELQACLESDEIGRRIAESASREWEEECAKWPTKGSAERSARGRGQYVSASEFLEELRCGSFAIYTGDKIAEELRDACLVQPGLGPQLEQELSRLVVSTAVKLLDGDQRTSTVGYRAVLTPAASTELERLLGLEVTSVRVRFTALDLDGFTVGTSESEGLVAPSPIQSQEEVEVPAASVSRRFKRSRAEFVLEAQPAGTRAKQLVEALPAPPTASDPWR